MKRRIRAFTLVELLVVIGIIAVLIAILLPGLNAARRQAQSIKCLASLQQIGQGFSLYAATYKGFWPCAVHDFGNPTFPLPNGRQMRWQDRILEFVTGIKGVEDYKDIATMVPNDVLRSSSVLWGCPTYRLQNGESNSNTVDDQVRTGYSMQVFPLLPGYSTNQYRPYIQGSTPPFQYSLATSVQTGRYFKATEWKKASDRLLMTEGYAYFIQMSPAIRGTGIINPSIHPWWPFDNTTQLDAGANQWENNCYFWVDGVRHAPAGTTKASSYNKQYMNALFCDGHAQSVSVRQAWQAIANPGYETAPAWP